MPNLPNNGSRLFVAATAISAVGLLTVPAMAHAKPPMPPLAPACTNYQFIGDYAIKQDDKWRVEFRATGQDAPGTVVTATSPSGEILRGTASRANIAGRTIHIDVNWANGWNSNYSGTVDKAGNVTDGRKVDSGHPGGEIHMWSSTVPLGCADVAKEPDDRVQVPPPPPPCPNGRPNDCDGDGMFDDDEKNGYNEGGFVTDPNNPDSDGDGVNDGAEDDNGTNPLDPNDP